MQIFLQMIPPTTTAQQKKVNFKAKTIYANSSAVDARNKYRAHLAAYVPDKPKMCIRDRFMNSTTKDKANTLLQIIGVGDKLSIFDKQEAELYNRRTEIGRIADQKKKYADETVSYTHLRCV